MEQIEFMVVIDGSAGDIDMSFGWKICPLNGDIIVEHLVQHLDKFHPSVLKAMVCYQHLAFLPRNGTHSINNKNNIPHVFRQQRSDYKN
eukprot:6119658-Ditylum_brightwellii.AAC.1